MFSTIYLTPVVQVHPMRLFMWLALNGACTFWIFVINYSVVCQFERLYKDSLTFGDVTFDDRAIVYNYFFFF